MITREYKLNAEQLDALAKFHFRIAKDMASPKCISNDVDYSDDKMISRTKVHIDFAAFFSEEKLSILELESEEKKQKKAKILADKNAKKR